MALRARIDRSVIKKASDLRPGDSRKYIDDFIKKLPCFVTGTPVCDDPHHLLRGLPPGSRGAGLRAADRYALPVVRWIHDAAHDAGDDEALFASLGFDVRSLTNELWALRHDPNKHVLGCRLLFKARQAAQLKVGLGAWTAAIKGLNARFGAAA